MFISLAYLIAVLTDLLGVLYPTAQKGDRLSEEICVISPRQIAVKSTTNRLPMNKSNATTASRVASDVAAIRAALKKHGYRTRKCPKKPTWIIFVNAQCATTC